jgi:hypothetical protein
MRLQMLLPSGYQGMHELPSGYQGMHEQRRQSGCGSQTARFFVS